MDTKEKQISDLLKINHYVLNLFPYWNDELLKQWEKEVTKLILLVTSGLSQTNFYRKLMRLSNLLNDGHTLVYLPKEIKSKLKYFPFKLGIVEDKLVISECGQDYKEYLFIPIKRINDLSKDQFITLCQKHGWQTQKEFSINLLQSCSTFLLEENTLEFEFEDNQKVSFPFVDQKYEASFHKSDKLLATATLLHESEEMFIAKVNEKILVKINHFMSKEVVTHFYKYVGDYLDVGEIIFDLRDNPGGNSEYADEIYQGFIDKPIEMEKAYRQVIDGEIVASATMTLFGEKDKSKYPDAHQALNHQLLKMTIEQAHFREYQGILKNVKVCILQNANTYSSAENFIINFDNKKRATLIGETTAGSTGQPAWIKLETGGMFMVTAKRVEYPNGKSHHNKGIEPDFHIKVSLEDRRSGVDSILSYALNH